MRLSKTVNLWNLGKSNVSLFPLTHIKLFKSLMFVAWEQEKDIVY